jgi:hypothetical protein
VDQFHEAQARLEEHLNIRLAEVEGLARQAFLRRQEQRRPFASRLMRRSAATLYRTADRITDLAKRWENSAVPQYEEAAHVD